LLPILFFFLAMSCSEKDTRLLQLTEIDNMMETSPQVAYDSLCHIEKALLSSQSRSVCMKFRILKAKAQNKLYLKMPSDSIFQDVVSFYDKKGNNNEKMESHYLMGCIYRDQNEAPQAMKCFSEAVEYADTVSKDCDYATLFSVYGQMAEIFVQQHLLDEAIAATKLYSKYAKKANDTYNYIRGKEFLIPYYYMAGDTVAAISQTKLCYQEYKERGMNEAAIRTLPVLISIYLNQGKYEKAYRCLSKIENKSGLFNKGHNIKEGWQHCYDLFARYYLAVGKIDSAEFYFRKLNKAGFHYEANRGLLIVNRKRNNVDSIMKYALLSEKEMDKILDKNRANAVKQSSSLYNYSRIERESIRNAQRVEKEKLHFYILCLIVINGCIGCIFWYRHRQRVNKDRYTKLSNDYVVALNDCNRLGNEIKYIEKDKNIVIDTKKERIKELEEQIQILSNKYSELGALEKNKLWQNSEIVLKFRDFVKPRLVMKEPTEDDWNLLASFMKQFLPLQYGKVLGDVSLGKQECRTCILISAGFSNSEIAILLRTSTQRIANAKKSANEKIFGDNKARSLLYNLQHID